MCLIKYTPQREKRLVQIRMSDNIEICLIFQAKNVSKIIWKSCLSSIYFTSDYK